MKYVVCDTCNNLIAEGSEVFMFEGMCGIFCSPQCFAEAHAVTKELTEELAEDCCTNMIEVPALENLNPNRVSDKRSQKPNIVPGMIARGLINPNMMGLVLEVDSTGNVTILSKGKVEIVPSSLWTFSENKGERLNVTGICHLCQCDGLCDRSFRVKELKELQSVGRPSCFRGFDYGYTHAF